MDWQDVFNFHGTLEVVKFHWVWMIVALGLGVWVGWYTGTGKPQRGNNP